MLIFNKELQLFANDEISSKAADILCDEIKSRTGFAPTICNNPDNADIALYTDSSIDKDSYVIKENDGRLMLSSQGIRGLIFAIGNLLRKIKSVSSRIVLEQDISGEYKPQKSIRGHQLGYRTTPNTYDAWDYEQYRRYYLDLMFFGVNMVEHIPYQDGHSNRNPLMKYDEEEFLVKGCEMADEYDLDVSLWQPNADDEDEETAIARRTRLFKNLGRFDVLFIPGSDPGKLPADELFKRCKAIKKVIDECHPGTELWVSAQMPHSGEEWAKIFIEELQKLPDEIDGVIFGPNHAYPLKELRELVPEKYPLRFYPDITHNVRCEYPVHYDRFDWHFALNANLSRECTNPRPYEYAKLHKETNPYVIGSCSYSEGITDDVNKCVWSALDFDESTEIREILRDYSRLYFFGADDEEISKLIMMLELNWEGIPEENIIIDATYEGFKKQISIHPELINNWRFLQLYLRATCDKYIREKRIFDIKLIEESFILLNEGKKETAKSVLLKEYSTDLKLMRENITDYCERMFELIGYQSSVEKYYADGWERGAILDTIDLPVSDKEWLLSIYDNHNTAELLKAYNRRNPEKGNLYYSVAHDGIRMPQKGEVYMNFKGDCPSENNGKLSTSLFNIFDNASFFGIFDNIDNNVKHLKITWVEKIKEKVENLTIKINGITIFNGRGYGDLDKEYTELMDCQELATYVYDIPDGTITDNKVLIELSETSVGVMFCEIMMEK